MERRVLKIYDHKENHRGSADGTSSDVCILVGTVHEEASLLGQASVTGSVGILVWFRAAIRTGF